MMWEKLLFILCCLSISSVFAAQPPLAPRYNKQSLVAAINKAFNEIDSKATIGVQIKSMQTNEVLYSRNAERGLTPASILKILTGQAALLFLGPNYRFSTTLLTTSPAANNGVIEGDLYLVHSGDPSLTYYDLNDLFVSLKTQQIHKIKGNVYIDHAAYDQMNYGPGWIWEDTRFCYAAPINASIINHNCLSFRIAPAKKIGHLANVILSPRYYYASIQNKVKTKSPWAKSCYVRLTGSNNVINLDGCMAKGPYMQSGSIVISNILQYNKSLLSTLLKHYKVKVTGQILAKPAPAKLFVLANHESKSLDNLVKDMLKNSDNVIAGSLFKKMGQLYFKQQGTWENGRQAVSNILTKTGTNLKNLNVIDGSGLSRDNRVSPSQMMQILNYAYHNYPTSFEFISALPIAGVDGTLKHRLKNAAWKIRAKTGTIAGVVSLAGYAVSKDQEPLAFVFIINGSKGNGWKYKQIEDRIAAVLTRFSRA